MDWPLSREEKKNQLLRLYNDDVRAADSMLSSGEAALEALREELDAVRHAAGIHKAAASTGCVVTGDALGSPEGVPASGESEVERLRQAVESAAAVLRAILPTPDDFEDGIAVDSGIGARPRSRSEGATREPEAPSLRPALCRTPRQSRGPKRKVSFGGQPEEEPSHVRLETDSEDDSSSKMQKITPQKHRDSIALHKERSAAINNLLHVNDITEGKSDSSSVINPGLRFSFKVHLLWFACGLSIAVLLGRSALQGQSGSPAAPSLATYGDPECWTKGFTPESCCFGPQGNPMCWDHAFTYERCCKLQVQR